MPLSSDERIDVIRASCAADQRYGAAAPLPGRSRGSRLFHCAPAVSSFAEHLVSGCPGQTTSGRHSRSSCRCQREATSRATQR